MNSISSFACAHITQPNRLQHNPISTRLQFFIHSLHFLCIATQQPENVNEKNFSCTCSLFFIHSCKDRCPSFGNANEYENPNETRVLMANTQIFLPNHFGNFLSSNYCDRKQNLLQYKSSGNGSRSGKLITSKLLLLLLPLNIVADEVVRNKKKLFVLI